MIKQLRFDTNSTVRKSFNEPNNVIFLQFNTITKTLELVDRTGPVEKRLCILRKSSTTQQTVTEPTIEPTTEPTTIPTSEPEPEPTIQPVVEQPTTEPTEEPNNTLSTTVEQNSIEETNLPPPLTFKANGETSILLRKVKSPNTINLQYKKNNDEWIDYNVGNVIDLVDGDTVSFSGNNETFSKDTTNYYKFVLSGENVQVSGNIQSLVNYNQSISEYQYYKLFNGCSSIVNAPELPVTTLAQGCYQEMFTDCENLSTAPELPATTLAESCYQTMFSGCINLTEAPTLSATTLAQSCYANMFRNCSALIVAPQLPATELKQSCYQNMFFRCRSLLTAPILPATTLEGLCYYGMFKGCTSLNSINVNFTEWMPTNATFDWVANISSGGTFYKPENLPEQYNGDTIPQGWTVVNK